MVTEKRQATLVIAGRSYPVQIDPSEEAMVHEVVSEVNRRVEEFQQRHPRQDKQDLLAMASLTLATELHRLRYTGEVAEMQQLMSDKIDRIEHLLDGLLS